MATESLRIALPTNQDFGLAEVALLDDPSRYPVAAPELPGRSDEELRHAAEVEGKWDLYDTHGIDQDPLPYRALWHRFKDSYRGEAVDEPGGFINAVLKMQRVLPTTQEYAATLAASGLIQPREAVNVPDQLSDDLFASEEGEDRARAHFKVLYLANATVPDLRTAESAARYASDRMKAMSNDEKAGRRAAELLSQARGIEGEDLQALMGSASIGMPRRRADRLRGLGMPNDLIVQLGDAPKPHPLYPRFHSAETIVDSVLGSPSLDRQIAYRRFFGMQNLAALAVTHAVVEKPFDDKSLAYSEFAISTHLSGSRLVHTTPKADTPFRSMFLNEALTDELGISEQMAALGALANFLMREPALNGQQDHLYPRSDILGHHVVSMVTADYRIWLDQRMDQEQQAS